MTAYQKASGIATFGIAAIVFSAIVIVLVVSTPPPSKPTQSASAITKATTVTRIPAHAAAQFATAKSDKTTNTIDPLVLAETKYTSALKKAKSELLQEFDVEIARMGGNKYLVLERKAFLEDGTTPMAPVMQPAVQRYRKARAVAKEEFDAVRVKQLLTRATK